MSVHPRRPRRSRPTVPVPVPVAAALLAATAAGIAPAAPAASAAREDAPLTAPLPAADAVLQTIAFGSCNRERESQDHWTVIAGHEPDLFLFIGDNVYADMQPDATGRLRMAPAADREQIQASWDMLAASPQWQRFRAAVPFLATWDDHDFGANDKGREWRLKAEAQEVFLDFCGVAADDPRRRQEGVHHAATFGPEGRRVQVILLDTRYHRDAIDRKPADDRLGPYMPTTDTSRSMLGEEQWAWLEEQLRQPADLRIIASSIQVLAWEHGWETWGTMPHERQRLLDLVGETGAEGVVFISGDRHLMEISCSRGDEDMTVPYPIWDFTSSGLNEGAERPVSEPNRYRVGPVRRLANFGLLRIDWDAPTGPVVRLEGRGGDDAVLMAADVELASLQPRD